MAVGWGEAATPPGAGADEGLGVGWGMSLLSPALVEVVRGCTGGWLHRRGRGSCMHEKSVTISDEAATSLLFCCCFLQGLTRFNQVKTPTARTAVRCVCVHHTWPNGGP